MGRKKARREFLVEALAYMIATGRPPYKLSSQEDIDDRLAEWLERRTKAHMPHASFCRGRTHLCPRCDVEMVLELAANAEAGVRRIQCHDASLGMGVSPEDGMVHTSVDLKVFIEQAEDGMFVATCPSLPGCVSQGRTHNEARTNIGDAVDAYIESLRKYGDPGAAVP